MALRVLFVLLLALNLAAAAWLLLAVAPAPVAPAATDKGVPLLPLLSERPATASSNGSAAAPRIDAAADGHHGAAPLATPTPAAAGTSPTAPTAPAAAASVATPAKPVSAQAPSTPAPRSYTCVALGPFATQADLRSARQALQGQSARQRTRQEQATQSRGWWVYLPASRSREDALALAKRLSAKGIDDYFVVGAGGQPNTISLGLFKDPANARKRREQVLQAGFPAQLTERTETVPEYWLDLALADGTRLDWRSRVHLAGVGLRATGCF